MTSFLDVETSVQSLPQDDLIPTFDNEILDLGLPTCVCPRCGACFWPDEALKCARIKENPTFSLCCQLGDVDIAFLPQTPALLERLLNVNGDALSKHYRTNIRSYNAAFSWTSFGAKFDPRLLNSCGPYSLVLNGENYHYMGSLLPPEGQPPRYTQSYLHDPTSEIEDRLAGVSGSTRNLDPTLMSNLKDMIDTHNVLAQNFRRVRDELQQPGNNNLRLRITGTRVERNRMYELPTGTELAGLNPTKKRKYVTQREYYCYRLQYRAAEGKTLIRSGKALQHFCIDAFTTIEQNRLTYLRLNQKKLWSDLYSGLTDALSRGDLDSNALGRIINPSSFTGSVRYMQQLYQDAIAVCNYFKNPDLFITFTCNAQWPEIVNAFKDDVGLHGEDKPMVIARVFRMRLDLLKKDLQQTRYFEKSIAIISAELPDPTLDPIGYNAVTKFMLHGPCGQSRLASPCMQDGRCSKFFPKPYASETTFNDHGHVTYRRRATNISAFKSGVILDNSYVVPYNRDLVVKYQAHINVEICHKGQLIKYLFKYITKGPDRSSLVAETTPIDEIAQYLDCRSISSYEAVWRLYKFHIHDRTPSVSRLSIHLPGKQPVTFDGRQSVASIVNRPDIQKTMLTEWFELNRTCPSARRYTYSDITHGYVWDKQCSQWNPRKQGFVISRIYSIPPRAGETFYLRILLTKIPGALSFEHLRTVNGILYPDYQKACQALGLLATDDEWNDVMAEVSHWGMPPLIRSTFVSLLMFCSVASPVTLFEQWWPSMADDFRRRVDCITADAIPAHLSETLRNQVLESLQNLLHNYSSSLQHVHLPHPAVSPSAASTNDLIAQQLDYDTTHENNNYVSSYRSLNHHQKLAHDAILSSIQEDKGKLFFLYGHGGTGKTFLYNCIIAKVRSLGKIALVVASSGIAATLLPGGVTAHSRFKIPIDVDHASTCSIKKGTSLARLMEQATLIVWDEAPMVHRLSFEAVDRTLCDIMNVPSSGPNYKPFGGKTVLLGGDFRQTLPVITNGCRGDNISASLTRSYLWNYCTLLELQANMRITAPNTSMPLDFQGMTFSEWILALGDGKILTVKPPSCSHSDWIKIPSLFLIPKTSDPIASLVDRVYPQLQTSYHNVAYIRTRAIVAPTNADVTKINDYILSQLPGEHRIYLSSDTFNGMPEHQLKFKQYTIVMLLRNLNPAAGLCNGTRILLTHLGANVIRGLIIGGTFEGTVAIIPRIVLDYTDPNWPFTLKRRQYPIRLCYAMTINKSQGQTLEHIGVYLTTPVFGHGQLYVALSRVRSATGIHIVLPADDAPAPETTRNIVYDEIFQDLQNRAPIVI
ncbi:ATP-dependent DNA helicase PIF1 [Linum grandiflorum]